jgi:hypothetical protein
MRTQRRLFCKGPNELPGLHKRQPHHDVRGRPRRPQSDDELVTLGEQPRFRVRETPDWKQHAADLEAEMIGRGMIFDLIDWSDG